MHTKMGPSNSRGTDSPLRTRMSWPVPMSCKALPTLPPPTMTAGTTLVAVVGGAMVPETLNLKALEEEEEVNVEMGRWVRVEKESKVAIANSY